MADSVREQKLAAARKKLRKFQKKKGTKRVADNISKEGTLDIESTATEDSTPLSECGTLSSRASSIDLASEDFPDPPQDVQTKIQSTNGDTLNIGFSLGTDYNKPETIQNVVPESDGIDYGAVQSDITSHTQMAVNTTQVSHNGVFQSPDLGNNGNDNSLKSGTSDVPQNQSVETQMQTQHNPLASYFQTATTQSDPFSFVSPNPAVNVVTQVDSTYDNFANAVEPHQSIASPTIIEPDELDVHEYSGTESSSAYHVLNPVPSEVLEVEEAKDVALEVAAAPVKTTEISSERQVVDCLDRDGGSVSSETTASVTTAIHMSSEQRQDHHPPLKSSSESLRQISLQLSGLMSETEGTVADSANSTIAELERRNSELAALLRQEQQTSQQQEQNIDQMKAQLERVEAELSAAQGVLSSSTGSGVRDAESMREQLQVHIQTIGILVSEKSELHSALTHANHALKQKAGEVTELDGRLSASRQRVSELEANLKDITFQHNSIKTQQTNLSKELDVSKLTHFKLNKQTEELKASVAELTERLSVKTSDYDKLASQLADTKGQLAMAQLHVQQLRDGTSDEIRAQLEQVQAAHVESKRQLATSEAALTQSRAENNQIVTQYQQYTNQLAEETRNLQQKVELLDKEKETLSSALTETKLKLETLQTAAAAPSTAGVSEEVVNAERERFQETIASMEEEKHQLREQNNAMTNDNSQLSKLVDQLSRNVEELEMKLERTKTDEVDTSRLLSAMQSDKVAAARALTQNKQLKEQLEELQSGFIIMSNKKLELTEKLEKELHVKKGLNQEIASLNVEVANMKQQAIEKERELNGLKENSESLGAQLMLVQSQCQLMAQQKSQEGNNVPLMEGLPVDQDLVRQLQEKLVSSNNTIAELTANNKELRSRTLENEHQENQPNLQEEGKLLNGDSSDNETPFEGVKELRLRVASLTSSLQQIETERDQLKKQLEQELHNRNTSQIEKTQVVAQNGAPEGVTPESFSKLWEAHQALETRFRRCMTEVAELSDEKQNLEHLVQQLQLENDSIGDYITIYQFQRGVMRQQAKEAELECSSLRHEREEMKIKLATLQELMSSLAKERGPDHHHILKMETVIKDQPTPIVNSIDGFVNGTMDENHIDMAQEASENSQIDFTDSTNDDGSSDMTKASTPNTESEMEKNSIMNSMQEPPPTPLLPTTDNTDTSTKSPTVQRILDLLNEMETSTQMEYCSLQKFHPCPLCSGKLITV